MLEILLLVYLCRKLGAGLRAKGHRAGWYQLFLVFAWFGGEFFGAFGLGVLLAIVDPEVAPPGGMLYLASLVGAALGALVVFWVARLQPDLQAEWDTGRKGGSAFTPSLPHVRDSGNPYQSPTYPDAR